MCRGLQLSIAGLLCLLTTAFNAQAQAYIGYVYPAGGQQGTTFQIKLGGQRLNGIYGAVVSGKGVKAELVDYRRNLSNQDMRLLREQLNLLKKKTAKKTEESEKIKERSQVVVKEWTNRPANRSLAEIVILEVKVAPNSEPGAREIRLVTSRGITNPLVFHVGQIPENTRKPMVTSKEQVLWKEANALRKRPADEVEASITLPCTLNGQIGSGEVNRYRFKARKGQKLVISTLARQLVPYIADAVPGWFQPVMQLHDADGREVAFNDDFRFKPDPTILHKVQKDGEYVLTINDSIYRGREDFVYRITIGELPLVTSIFPLGSQLGKPLKVKMDGWNLENTRLVLPPQNAGEGVHLINAKRREMVSNHVPYALDTLPESFEKEGNNDVAHAQKLTLPVIINGGSNRPGDWDVFKVEGRGGDTIVAEVYARRLDSPLDSLLKLTDEAGRVIAFNDDHSDPGSGLNTHHADSYLMARLPEDGTYYIHLSDTTHSGGEAYAYRLRVSKPRPDFELRTEPSRIALKSKSSASVTVYAIRKDGYDGPIKLRLKDAPEGFSAKEVYIPKGKEKTRIALKCNRTDVKEPVGITIEGYTKVGGREIARAAVPSDDYMQAFLWRHLVPAQELVVHVYNTSYVPVAKRVPPPAFEGETELKTVKGDSTEKKQVVNRMKQIKRLYEEWFLTDDYYQMKVAEYKAAYDKF